MHATGFCDGTACQPSWLRRRAFSSAFWPKVSFFYPASEPGSFDAIAEVEVYACYCLGSNFHQFAVERETEAAHGDLARSLGYHVVCVCVCVCVVCVCE